jgi:hypothetical protein
MTHKTTGEPRITVIIDRLGFTGGRAGDVAALRRALAAELSRHLADRPAIGTAGVTTVRSEISAGADATLTGRAAGAAVAGVLGGRRGT